jgi:Mg-chelatase subunit ChlD
MSKKKFLICFVLDETGSMEVVREATINGYNEYVDSLRDQKKTKMVLVKFNSNGVVVGDLNPIADAIKLSRDNYKPAAITPLYDAVGETIGDVEKYAENREVIFVIMTDGLENASKEYTRDNIFKLISEKEESGWQFVYLGANQDAFAVGQSIGVPMATSFNYSQSKTAETFNSMSIGTRRYIADPDSDEDFLTKEEKEKIK